MTATPAGPTLTSDTDPAGDPIVQTGSGLVLTNEHLTVLVSCATSNRVAVLKVIHMATNTKVVKIASTSPAEPGVLIDMAAYPDQFILCLNTAEVRKVGLAGVR